MGMSRGGRRAAAGIMAAVALGLAGCTMNLSAPAASTPHPPEPTSPPTPTSTPAPTSTPTPTAPATVSMHLSGTGPEEIPLPNPYWPLQEGRESIGLTMTFSCTGGGEFHVDVAPRAYNGFGGSSCTGGSTGVSSARLGLSVVEYTIDVDLADDAEWSLDVLLTPPAGR